ncbi:uncharacterized protein LAJ45_07244 [Morchella importuna]|uniref:uncharacterized protein n=1 Tax=Morchella importuna TaxID=1174673 RepID=UPI001E8DD8E7|nr:uncharacterized protein LAJ45_07244 [Morchella importuna]KAH8148533.1 hypothetical protein LAJ45_07244 [Morchella importuna]
MYTIPPIELTPVESYSTLVTRARIHKSYYDYNPSRTLAIIATALYATTCTLHILQVARYRAWYFSVIIVAGLMETFGYATRVLSQADVFSRGLFIAQFSLVVLAPVLIAAASYILFGRLLETVLPGGRNARSLGVPARWVTWIFLTGDITSFVLQGIGAGIMSGASGGTNMKKMNTGRDVMLTGLAVQIVTFGFFIAATVRFDFKSRSLATLGLARPRWRILLWALYASSVLIMVRSCYRVAEFSQGWTGYLASHEVYFYCLEALPMFPCFVIFNIFHPSRLLDTVGKEDVVVEEGSGVGSMEEMKV